MDFIKILLTKLLSLIGYKINRTPPRSEIYEREEKEKQELQREELESKLKQELITKNRWLSNLKIKTVLDIGANTGQFAENFLTILPDIELYCFEPIKTCYAELKQNLEHNNKVNFFNFALGNENGEKTIFHNEYSPSSSILEMNNLHKEAFAFTEKAEPEVITIKKLDEITGDLNIKHPLLIKIDVQGFEMEVLKGGLETIKLADIIIIETTFEELYSGQPLFNEIYAFFQDLGFVFKGNFEQLTNPNDGRILQADSIFVKI